MVREGPQEPLDRVLEAQEELGKLLLPLYTPLTTKRSEPAPGRPSAWEARNGPPGQLRPCEGVSLCELWQLGPRATKANSERHSTLNPGTVKSGAI